MVLYTSLWGKRLDVEVFPPVAVLAEQQPCEAVINAGFTCGILAVDVGAPGVKLDFNMIMALEIFQCQRNEFHFHGFIFLSDPLGEWEALVIRI